MPTLTEFILHLKLRKKQAQLTGGADKGQQHMVDEMGECIRQIEALMRQGCRGSKSVTFHPWSRENATGGLEFKPSRR